MKKVPSNPDEPKKKLSDEKKISDVEDGYDEFDESSDEFDDLDEFDDEYTEEGVDAGGDGEDEEGGDEGGGDDGYLDGGGEASEVTTWEGPIFPWDGNDWQEYGFEEYHEGTNTALEAQTGLEDYNPDGPEDPNCGVVGGILGYIDANGNQYQLDVGINDLDNGETVIVSSAGAIQEIILPSVTINGSIEPSSGEIDIDCYINDETPTSTSFNGLTLASGANSILSGIGSGYDVVSLSSGGMVDALNTVVAWNASSEISFADSINVFFGVSQYLGIFFSLPQFNLFVNSMGYTMQDVIDLFNI